MYKETRLLKILLADVFIHVHQFVKGRIVSDRLDFFIFFRTFETREDKRERDDSTLNIDDC